MESITTGDAGDAVVLIEIFDRLLPRLDTYEQALYLYIFRHTRLIGKQEAIIGLKSATKRMAFGVGAKNTRISEGTIYTKLRSLQDKGCIELRDVTRSGTRIHLNLPFEIPGVLEVEQRPQPSLEELDFCSSAALRLAIFQRDGWRCAYCRKQLTPANAVVEHVLSRPSGNSRYTNLVAACARCNSRKGSKSAADFLRQLFREDLLTDTEFKEQLRIIHDTQQGLRVPAFSSAA